MLPAARQAKAAYSQKEGPVRRPRSEAWSGADAWPAASPTQARPRWVWQAVWLRLAVWQGSGPKDKGLTRQGCRSRAKVKAGSEDVNTAWQNNSKAKKISSWLAWQRLAGLACRQAGLAAVCQGKILLAGCQGRLTSLTKQRLGQGKGQEARYRPKKGKRQARRQGKP